MLYALLCGCVQIRGLLARFFFPVKRINDAKVPNRTNNSDFFLDLLYFEFCQFFLKLPVFRYPSSWCFEYFGFEYLNENWQFLLFLVSCFFLSKKLAKPHEDTFCIYSAVSVLLHGCSSQHILTHADFLPVSIKFQFVQTKICCFSPVLSYKTCRLRIFHSFSRKLFLPASFSLFFC